MELLDIPLGPFTFLQWTLGAVGFGVVLGVWNKVRGAGPGAPIGGQAVPARCLGCGWSGEVSKYHRQCPKCGNSITRLNKR